MYEYKICYIYTECATNDEGRRVSGHDIYEADNAQDAVDQCRQDFYIGNELEIVAIYKRSYYGWSGTLVETWT